jgi:hypothetical protein
MLLATKPIGTIRASDYLKLEPESKRKWKSKETYA